ncbi:unnamed protein product [Somion occarium]|uniref:Spermatogenesis-associated protein 20-like TRX domain-containing protein n=1 Tax=Somion occarium TaxID=3059160 RepID=A0ABP1DLF0_9APHY
MAQNASKRPLNRLAQAKSPYLLQHAENPVDWYEWGPEAFEKAKREDKPIFLSVGYSACHWCHVLAHESFEDEVTAKIMNDSYVNVKVDREERPDVDRVYMTFLQASSGGGGWPMSVWLTPDLHPFFAGTYFPPSRFRDILVKLAQIWETDKERVVQSGKSITEQLQDVSAIVPDTAEVSINKAAEAVYNRLARSFDLEHGGSKGAPKFPSPAQTTHFLARYAALNPSVDNAARDMAVKTLMEIFKGGIHDHIGQGFARYSVDEHWHVPHFEKMLYDQAQLLSSALEISQLLPDNSLERGTLQAMAADIITYVSRDLRGPQGAFYSAEDADSLPSKDSTVKKEGAFYVWTDDELHQLLGEDAEIFNFAFGIKRGGNCDPKHDIQGELEGKNVLYIAHSTEETAKQFNRSIEDISAILELSNAKLKEYRDNERPRPHLDDKILTCWNGLMISGLSKAAEALTESHQPPTSPLKLAEDAADFIRKELYNEASGELRRSYREGPGPVGQADDYAFLIQGLLDLYEASGKEEYASWAIRLQEKQDELFYDNELGGYYVSAPDEHIIVRMKEAQDGAEPSAASISLYNLNRLSHFAEDKYKDYHTKARSVIKSNSQLLNSAPFAVATMVSAAMMWQKGYKQFIVTGSPSSVKTVAFFESIRKPFIPNRVLIHLDPDHPPQELARLNGTLQGLITEDSLANSEPNIRICETFTCGLPIYETEELKKHLI